MVLRFKNVALVILLPPMGWTVNGATLAAATLAAPNNSTKSLCFVCVCSFGGSLSGYKKDFAFAVVLKGL